MKVFYIYIENAKKIITKDVLFQYADIELKTQKRFYEYTLGRYLIKNTAKKFYNIDDEIVINENGKPEFKAGEIYFSLSHSKNIIAVCLDENPCGIDVEYMKERNLKEISEYYGQEFETLEDFYKFWTKQEAEYKLGEKAKYSKSFRIKDYYLTVVSDRKINKTEIFNFIQTND